MAESVAGMSMTGAGSVKRRKTGKQSADGLMDEMMTEGLEEIMNRLKESPELIFPCLQMVKSGRLKVQAKQMESAGEKPFPATYTKLMNIPKDFLFEFLPYLTNLVNKETYASRSPKHCFATVS